MERRRRSIMKAITFRVIATLTTMALVLWYTKSWALANTIGFLDLVSKLTIYYLHERVWDHVAWGMR